MIDSSVIAPAQQLSAEYTANGKVLSVASAGPLSDLVSSLRVMNHRAENVMSEVIMASQPQNGGLDRHTFEKDKQVAQLTELMNSTINYTKNYINVHIQETMKGVEEIQNRVEAETVTGNIRVKAVSKASILDSEYLEMLLGGVVGKGDPSLSLSDETVTRAWRSASATDIITTMRTASDGFNADLAKFISTYYPGDSIKMLSLNDNSMVSTGQVETYEKNHDLALFLFLSGLYAGRHPSVSFDSLSEGDRRAIKSMINFWGSKVNSRLDFMGMLAKNSKVILKTDAEKDTIYVNKTPYTKWLSEGGTSDALIGYWLSTGKSASATNADIALANSDRFIKQFNRNQKLAMSNMQLAVNREAEKYIVRKVISIINDEIKDEAEKKEMVIKANKLYRKMDISAFDSIDDYCRLMVCKTIGKDSDAYEILTTMTDFMKENPEATIDEAVLVAASDRLVEVVFGQIQVFDEKVGLRDSVDL